MAAGPVTLYDSFIEALGDGTIDLDTDVLNLALFTSTYTPAQGSDVTYSALTGEVAAITGYATGGPALSGVAWTHTGQVSQLDASDEVFSPVGADLTARYGVIYSVSATGNDLIGYFLLDDTPADVTATDGNTLTVTWAANGMFQITVPTAA